MVVRRTFVLSGMSQECCDMRVIVAPELVGIEIGHVSVYACMDEVMPMRCTCDWSRVRVRMHGYCCGEKICV